IAGSHPSTWNVKDGGWRETYTRGKDGKPSRHVPDPQYKPELDTKPPRRATTTTTTRRPSIVTRITTTTTTTTTTSSTTTTAASTVRTRASVRPSRPPQTTAQPRSSSRTIDVAGIVRNSLGEDTAQLSKAIRAFQKNRRLFVRQLAAFLSIVQSLTYRKMRVDESYLSSVATEVFGTSPWQC
ncbi:hypothetical protein FOZ62_020352, partial [Perkinsus olseni]